MRQSEVERRQKSRETGNRLVKIDYQTPYASPNSEAGTFQNQVIAVEV